MVRRNATVELPAGPIIDGSADCDRPPARVLAHCREASREGGAMRSDNVTWAEALEMLPPNQEGRRYAEPLCHGTMRLGLYAPRRYDPQKPHEQDELYVVMHGSGIFMHGGERTPFGPGDALFVAAGIEHRFEDFSDDFATWVIFWGPAGGEHE